MNPCSTGVSSVVELVQTDSEPEVKMPDTQELSNKILDEIAPSTSGVKRKLVRR